MICMTTGRPILVVALALFASAAAAQSYIVRPLRDANAPPAATQDKKESKTLLEVELLLDGNGAGLAVHEWNKVFRDLDVSVRVRRGLPGEEIGVTEQPLGPLRQVRVLGRIDGNGRIVLPDRTYTTSEAAELGEWFRELETYGAQGNPDGKPLWGLSKGQFGAIHDALSAEPVAGPTAGEPLDRALARLRLPEKYPLRMTVAAREHLARYGDAPAVRKEVGGFSHGTALAMVLGDFGLGFRPLRTPEGEIELVIDPLADVPDAWPIGWEPPESPIETVPGLFEIVPVELAEVPLTDVLDAISEKSEVPVRIDHHLIEKHNIALDEIHVSYRPRKTSWNLLLRGLLNAEKLSHEIRIDERGTPFVWVSTLKIGRLGR